MMIVGLVLSNWLTSWNSGGVYDSSVGGMRSPSGTPGSSGGTGSAKLLPLLCGGPAAGCGSESTSSAARLVAGTCTSPMVSSGTNTAPPGMTIWVPSGMLMTRSRPLTWISDSSTPGGEIDHPLSGGRGGDLADVDRQRGRRGCAARIRERVIEDVLDAVGGAGIADVVELAVGIHRQQAVLAHGLEGAIGLHGLTAGTMDLDDHCRGGADFVGSGLT